VVEQALGSLLKAVALYAKLDCKGGRRDEGEAGCPCNGFAGFFFFGVLVLAFLVVGLLATDGDGGGNPAARGLGLALVLVVRLVRMGDG